MNPLRGCSYPHLAEHLISVLTTEFKADRKVYKLFDQFFRHRTYDRRFALQLCAIARGVPSRSWDIRRVAALMLEHQLLQLSPGDLTEHSLLFERLNILSASAAGKQPRESLLREGFTTTELRAFIVEFRRKLDRLERIHSSLKGRKTSQKALLDFIHLSRHDCKLSLARYLWEPEEVFERILQQVQLSTGRREQTSAPHPYVEEEAERTLSLLPGFEASILRRLCGLNKIYWVADDTSSRLNSLVEYPLTTIVLTVKPPGSAVEFELKRAGARGRHLLNVDFGSNGRKVDISHRFHAGSIGNLLRWDAGAVALLSKIYRAAHGVEPPVAKTLSISYIRTIPVKGTEHPLPQYFTNPEIFGEGFGEMRSTMAKAIEAYKNERDWNPPPPADDLEMTKQFLSQVGPSQAVLAGTSSYRLNRLAEYLSADGPEFYFTRGLKVPYTKVEARQLADDLLEEVLGVYVPPGCRYRHHEQYVGAAFAVPENRVLADRRFLAAMRQVGEFWGTLLALKAHSQGESFVTRNVGLKSCWEEGEWQVKLIYMDHDELDIIGKRDVEFRPRSMLWSTIRDERHIFGGTWNGRVIKGEVETLKEIYRVEPATARKGLTNLRGAMKSAHRKTLEAVATREELRRLFRPSLLEQFSCWDAVVARYLKVRREPDALASWKEEAGEFLSGRGLSQELVENYLEALEKHERFLRAYAFLY